MQLRSEKNSTVFNLKCTCGNESFKVFKGKTHEIKKSEKKWDNYWKKFRFIPIFSYSDTIERKTGKRYTYGSTFLGIRVGKLYNETLDFVKDISFSDESNLKFLNSCRG